VCACMCTRCTTFQNINSPQNKKVIHSMVWWEVSDGEYFQWILHTHTCVSATMTIENNIQVVPPPDPILSPITTKQLQLTPFHFYFWNNSVLMFLCDFISPSIPPMAKGLLTECLKFKLVNCIFREKKLKLGGYERNIFCRLTIPLWNEILWHYHFNVVFDLYQIKHIKYVSFINCVK